MNDLGPMAAVYGEIKLRDQNLSKGTDVARDCVVAVGMGLQKAQPIPKKALRRPSLWLAVFKAINKKTSLDETRLKGIALLARYGRSKRIVYTKVRGYVWGQQQRLVIARHGCGKTQSLCG